MPHHTSFQPFAEALERDATKLDLAVQQETRPHNLKERADRVPVHAVKQLLAAEQAGADLLGPIFPGRSALTVDQSSDESLLGYWRVFVLPMLRAKAPEEFAANSGAYEFPHPKRDAKGRIVGRSGKPLKTRVKKNAAGKIIGYSREEPAWEEDDFDAEDTSAAMRRCIKDWADGCRAAAKLLRGKLTDVPLREARNV